jgi:hypothetical protein
MKLTKIFLLIALGACSVSKTKLSSRGEKVDVLANKPKEECSVLDRLVAENDKGSVELARNHARNLAAKVDANAVWFEQEIVNGNSVKIHFTAYHCK